MKIHITTFGCSLNQSDSEMMAGLLLVAGHKIVSSAQEADVVVFNTCTVKDSPEKSFYSLLEKMQKAGKKVVVAGCVSQADPANPKLKGVSIVGVRHLEMICEAVEAAIRGRVIRLISFRKNQRLNLPKLRKNPVVEILPISSGCLGECTFCKTRFGRGALFSYEPSEIKKQLEAAVHEGVKEIWLTSQDSGAYGLDLGTNLIRLLDELVKVPGDYKIRLGMINPDLAKNIVPGLIRFLNHEHAFKFIHLPVQSGSDAVLKSMKRGYTCEDFETLLVALRKGVPGLTVATDIIVGFPGESEEDYASTVRLVKKAKFSVLNLTKFYPRAGTLAARMKLHPTKLVKKRSTELAALQKKLVDNNGWIGWSGKIIIDEQGKGDSWVGRNEFYRPIVVRKAALKLGVFIKVRVIAANPHYLIAEIY